MSTANSTRDQMLEYVCGQLPDAQRRQFEEAMLARPDLAHQTDQLRDLLSAARQAPEREWTGARAEANLDGIRAALQSTNFVRADEFVSLEVAGNSSPVTPQVRAFLSIALALAAGTLLFFAGRHLVGQQDSDAAPSELAAASPSEAPANEPGATPATEPPLHATREPASPADYAAEIAAIVPRNLGPEPFPGKVFATDRAEWRIDARNAGNDDWILYLGDGALLVEWLPVSREKLWVYTPDASVEVTGTVFFVTTLQAHSEISVVEGSVVVRARSDVGSGRPTTAIAAGNSAEISAAGLREARPSSQSLLTARQLVDLPRHRSILAQRSEARQQALAAAAAVVSANASRIGAQPPTTGASAAVGSAGSMRSQDTRAIEAGRIEASVAESAGNLDEAARLLESMDPASPRDRRAVRLDLARIYLQTHTRKQSAGTLLRELIDEAPDDPIASVLRRELCALSLAPDQARCRAQ